MTQHGFVRMVVITGVILGVMSGCSGCAEPTALQRYTCRIVNTYPHDPGAFTQGLVFHNGFLYEGTGQYGQSSLRKVVLETGEVILERSLANQYFGEGIAVWGDSLFQLTWREKKGFVYNLADFEPAAEFSYATEGWGLTHDGSRLIMSDGTSTLYFLNPETRKVTGRVEVYDNAGPVRRLNELEYIDNRVYANVWRTNRIVIINPTTGMVEGVIDLEGLLENVATTGSEDVLNGIAYDAANDRLYVTGKLWPALFEIELVEQTP